MPLLHWLTRDDDIHAAAQTPYRLLEEVASQSQDDRDAGNMLIQGDNLDALKALLPYYAGRVKCIFIDPPYNTRSAFEHYDDNTDPDDIPETPKNPVSRVGDIWTLGKHRLMCGDATKPEHVQPVR